MERNPDKIGRFLGDILRTQPNGPRIVGELFSSLGFANVQRLMQSSKNIGTFLEDAEAVLGQIDVPETCPCVGYMRASVPHGTNPLDLLNVITGERPANHKYTSSPFFIQIGKVYADGQVTLTTLRSGRGKAAILELENQAAVNYLLEERHKRAA